MPDILPQPGEAAATASPAAVLHIVLDHLAQGLAVIGPDLRLVAFNRKFVDIFRLPPATFQIGKDYRDVLRTWAECTGQDRAMLDRAIRELELPEPFEFEFPQSIHGETRWCLLTHSPLPTGGCVRTFTDITAQKRMTSALEDNVRRLEQALAEVQELREILPICMYCKKVRDDENYWSQIDHYLSKHAGTRFTHGICPDCLETRHPGLMHGPATGDAPPTAESTPRTP